MKSMIHTGRLPAIGFLLVSLTGCATFSEDGGFTAVEEATVKHLGEQATWLRDDASKKTAAAEVERLLAVELTPKSVVQIALLNNPGLQASYAELGISEAELVQAGRMPNPGFSYGNTSNGGAQEIERGLGFSVFSLLTMPIRVGIEERRFEAAKLRAAGKTIDLVMETRKAYFNAIAASQATDYMREVQASAEASRDLMSRMKRVGNASRIDLAREQLFLAEVTTASAKAAQAELVMREALVRKLGLWGKQVAFKWPSRLPALPESPKVIDNVEQESLAQRFDLRLARHNLDALATSLGLTKATRFINALEVGPAQVRESGEPIRDGYHITFEIPIFDWGGARVAKAELLYQQASQRFREAAIAARSDMRLAYHAYRSNYDIARHYRDVIVPLRKEISDEQLLQYNGMLVGVFELISGAREQVLTINSYMEALRDFWNADIELQHALLNGGLSGGMDTPSMAMPASGDAKGH